MLAVAFAAGPDGQPNVLGGRLGGLAAWGPDLDLPDRRFGVGRVAATSL